MLKGIIINSTPISHGLIGFFIGGFVVFVGATTFFKPNNLHETDQHTPMSSMPADMISKTGDAYDEAYLIHMIEHHEGAIDMAKHSAANAKHDEIKQLSESIARSQAKEIADMKRWQIEWGYMTQSSDHR